MRYKRLIQWFGYATLSCFFWQSAAIAQERPSIGLVLSGGGAKGFAHIGVLKMLDSLDIPIDYITGTSMGGIMGGLYAIGYTGLEIEELVTGTNWDEIFTDRPPRPEQPYQQKKDDGDYQVSLGLDGLKPYLPSGIIFGQKISLLFSGLAFPYEKIYHFDDLPIPYRCIAVDIATGNEVVLDRGSLAKAMRATMAIPTVFSPVRWGDSLLVDGGMVNNLPVDVIKRMGADIVIAVDVGVPLMGREKLRSAVSILNQSIAMLGRERWKKNITLADIVITPEIDDFTPADFQKEKISRIISLGDAAAAAYRVRLQVLKNSYALQRSEPKRPEPVFANSSTINILAIKGNRKIPRETLCDELDLHSGAVFNRAGLDRSIARLKMAGKIDDIHYEIMPLTGGKINLIVQVSEKEFPLIYGITITGNERLPFSLIYRMLGLNPGDPLNTNDLNRRIMKMYGNGSFESIQYQIEPREGNYVQVDLSVRERPERQLRIGMFYDNQHRLVGSLGFGGTDMLLPGLHIEGDWQFAGLYYGQIKMSYPLRLTGLPVYPYIRTVAKDIPVDIYSYFDGSHIARFGDKSSTGATGFGIDLANAGNLEVEYQQEEMDVNPEISSDPTLFPQWNETLRKIFLSLRIDNIDNVNLPRRGFMIRGRYENSLKSLHTDIAYYWADLSADVYTTLHNRHTFRFYAYRGISHNVPNYKFFHIAAPHTFIGMESDQLFGHHISIARVDYRFQVSTNVYATLSANRAFDLEYRRPWETYLKKPVDVWGAGFGLKIITPLGPLDWVYGYGDKTFNPKRKRQKLGYITFGFNIGRTLSR